MMAVSRKMQEQEPGPIELLLPWHAAGTLNARDARLVEEALARDPELAKQYAAIREEQAAIVDLNESLGAPSPRTMHKLLAAIDAEPRSIRRPANVLARLAGFLGSLSPGTLTWSASLATLALLVQAGVIGAMLSRQEPTVASKPAPAQRMAEAVVKSPPTLTRALGSEPAAPRIFVRFAADARVSDITALLDNYQAAVIDSAKGGTFKLQVGDQPLAARELAELISRLQGEKIVTLALPAP